MLLYPAVPALPNVPDTLLVQLTYDLGEDLVAQNRFHITYIGGPPTVVQLQTEANTLYTNWALALNSNFSPDTKLTAVEITDLTSPTAARGGVTGSEPGTHSGGQPLPGGSATRITFDVARRYRGGKPGIFVPLTDATMLTDPQTINATYLDSLNINWQNYVSAALTATNVWASGSAWTSVSYYTGFHTFTEPSGRVRNIPTLRISPVVDSVIGTKPLQRPASQRRRNLTRT